MASHISERTGQREGAGQSAAPRRWLWMVARAFVGCLASIVVWPWSLFRRKAKRAVPVVHEDVVLTQEGAAMVKQAMDPTSSVGKPVHHCRRRIEDGDADR